MIRTEVTKAFEQTLEELARFFSLFWNVEIVTIGERSIRASNLIIGVIFIVLGFVFASILSRLFVRSVKNRFHFTESTATTTRVFLYYGLLFLFTLFALNVANIPLTVFTLFGGAIALGVGFGS